MPNDQKSIKPNAARKQAPRKQNLDNKPIKKVGDGTMGFMLWSIAGTVLASCSSPIFSDVADLTGGGGGGNAQSGPPGFVTNGRWANTNVFLADENGARVSGSDAVGITDGAGSIILNDGISLIAGQQYMAALEGGIEISTNRLGVSGEELLSLPYVSGEALIISPLTDLLARQLMDSTNAAEVDAMGQDAFIQKVLNDIFGERPQFDDAGAAIVELDANGDRMEGEFVNPTPQVTLADVLEADNYNAFVNDDTVTRLVSLASNELGVSPGTGSVGDLMTLFDDARTLVESEADEATLETQLDAQLVLIKQVFDARDDTTTANSRPVAANPNEGDPISMTEDQNFTVVRGNAETLFGFEDPFGNAGAADGARVDGEFEGIYIEAASMGGDVAVMFRLEDDTIVDLDDQRAVTARGAPSDGASPAMTTIDSVRFYYVSEANFGQLVLMPDRDFNTASITDEDSLPQIRFYVYDGEHATVDDGGSLNGIGTLKIVVANVNDAPVVNPPAAVSITSNTDSASGTFTASDIDGDMDFRWTATPTSTSYGTFGFTDSQGAWTFTLNESAFDALPAGMDVPLTFDITAIDGNGGVSAPVTLTIMLQGQNDAPTDITTGGAALTASYDDNPGIPSGGIFIATLSTEDADTGDTHTYTIDEAMLEGQYFSIRDGNGVVSTEGTHLWLDGDADARAVDGTWEVEVTSTDAGNERTSKTFTITRTDANINAAPTDITTDVAGASAALTATYDGDDVPTGGHVVAVLDSTDPNSGDTHTYSIVPNDNGQFTIRNGNQLVLREGAASPAPGGTLDVTVRSTDAGTGTGGLTFDKTFTITRAGNVSPTDITTTATGTSAALTATYDGARIPTDGVFVATLDSTDLNPSDLHTYSITGGADRTSFSIRDGVGSSASPSIDGNHLWLDDDANSPAPGEMLEVTIRTTDIGTGAGGLTFEKTFTITRAGNADPAPDQLAVSSEGVRDSVVIYGVEFRQLENLPPLPASGLAGEKIAFRDRAENDPVTFSTSTAVYIVRTRDFSQADIARIWNTDTTSNSRFVATIIAEMPNIDTYDEWEAMELGGAETGVSNITAGRSFAGYTDDADLMVTEGSDLTASGWLQVTGATGDIIFGAGGTSRVTATGELGGTSGNADHTDTREYTYAGEYGNLVIDGDGDWVYTLGGTTDQNNDLGALTSTDNRTELFTVTVRETGGTMETVTEMIRISVTGADEVVANRDPEITEAASGVIFEVVVEDPTDSSTDTPPAVNQGSNNPATSSAYGNFIATDADAGDTIAWSMTGASINASMTEDAFDGRTAADFGALTVNADGTWSFAPTDAINGLDTNQSVVIDYTIQASDGNGGIDTSILRVTLNGETNATPNNDPEITEATSGVIFNVVVDDPTDSSTDTPPAVDQSSTNPATSSAYGNFIATDADTGDTIAWSMTGASINASMTEDAFDGRTAADFGALTVNADGTWSFAPTDAINGLDTNQSVVIDYTIQASDGNGGIDTSILRVTLNGETNAVTNNDPEITEATSGVIFNVVVDDPTDSSTDTPPAVDQSSTNPATSSAYGNFIATDADAGDTIAWSMTGASINASMTEDAFDGRTAADFGALTVNADGTWSFAPTDAINGLDTNQSVVIDYTIQASDGNGGIDTSILRVTLNGETNATPNNDPEITEATSGVIFNVVVDDPTDSSTDTPPAVNQGSNNPATSSAYGSFAATDADTGDTIAWSMTGASINASMTEDAFDGRTAADFGALTVNADGTWSFAPTDAINGLDTNQSVVIDYTIQASDGNGGIDTSILRVTLNGETNATPNNDPEITEATSGVIFNVVVDDPTDSSTDTPPAVDQSSTNPATSSAYGNFIATDADAGDTIAWSMTGASINASMTEDAFDGRTAADFGALTVDGTGTWSFAPTDAINGLDTNQSVVIDYTIQASDGNGGTDTSILRVTLQGRTNAVTNNDPEITEATSGVIFNVVVDDPTDSSTDVPPAVNQGSNNPATSSAYGSFAATDADAGDTIAWSMTGASINASMTEDAFDGRTAADFGALTVNADGTWSFAPTDAINGLDTNQSVVIDYTIQASDGNGGIDTSILRVTLNGETNATPNNDPEITEATSGVIFNVVVDDPTDSSTDTPPAVDQSSTNPATSSAYGNFIATDADAGDTIAWSMTGASINASMTEDAFDGRTAADFGALTVNADGTWSFAPTDAINGLDTNQSVVIDYTIQASDGNGGIDTSILRVTLNGETNATPNNDPVIVTGSGIFSDGLTIPDPTNAPSDDPMAVVSTGITRFTANDPDAGDTITWSPATPLQGSPLVATGSIDVSSAGTLTNANTRTAAEFGALTVNIDGTWSFDPTAAINDLDTGESVVLSYVIQAADGNGGTDTETLTVTLEGLSNAAGGLMVTNEAVRAFVIVNGVEFRINTDGSTSSSYEVEFSTTSTDEYVAFAAPSITVYADTRDANEFSQANIASIFNAAGLTNLNVAAIILDVDTTTEFTVTNWDADGTGGPDNEYDFSPVTSTLDRAVTEDDATDETARGFLEVTGGTGSYTYTGGDSTRDIGAGTDAVRYQIFNGMYGELIVDANGNWTYTIDNAAAQALNSGPPATEMFTVTVGETGSIRTVDHVIAITVNGVDEPTPAPVFSGASEPTGTVTDTDTAFDNTPESLMGRSILLDAVTGVISWSVDTPVVAGDTSESAAYFGELTFPGSVFVNFGTAFDRTGSGLPWQFDPTTGINDLGAGQSVTITYAVTASNAGGSAPQDLVITLMGIDDAPEITAGLTGSSASADGATGRITATDVDGDTITFADSTNADYGDLTFSRVGITDEYEWTLSLNSDGMTALAALGDGVTQDITFEITAATGGTETTTETLTIELTGTASDNLVVTNEAVRAFVIVKGVEFRVNTDSNTSPSYGDLVVQDDSDSAGVNFNGGQIFVFALSGNYAQNFLPANIARIFNDPAGYNNSLTGFDIAAIILEENTTPFGRSERNNFSSVNATLDVTVTEDDAADNTARGFLEVMGAADGDTYTYTGGSTRDIGTGRNKVTYQIFDGIYGQLIVDGDGNWTYVLDNTNPLTQGLDDPQEGTDRFTVTVSETGGAMRTEEAMIEITVNGAADADPSLDVTNEAVRAFVVINGVEFRINADSNAAPRNDYKIIFDTTSAVEGANFVSSRATITLTIDTRSSNPDPFSQVNIARLFNEAADITGLDVVAIILEADTTTTFTDTDWTNEDFSSASTTLDRTVTEDDEADETARGFLQVTGATEGDTYTYTGDFEGKYGDLKIDGDGNWTYIIDNTDPLTQGLDGGMSDTDDFAVTVSETSGAMRTEEVMISITVNGAAEVADLDVTNEAVRAFVVINGVEFRINADSNAMPRSDYKITFDTTSQNDGSNYGPADGTIELSIDTRPANPFSQANIARLFNEADLTGLDVVAIILEEDTTTTFAVVDWTNEDFSPASTIVDRTVTEDDAADNTAGGFLQVTGATEGDTYTYTTADFEGTYGDLTIDDNGNWTYVLNNADDDTQRLSGNDALTDDFDVLITQTAGTGSGRTGTETIRITVNGADEELAALVVTSQSTDTAVTEDDAADTTATGAFVVMDPPTNPTYTYSGISGGTYGNLTVDVNGNWTYTIDNAATDTQALNSRQTRTDTITVTITETGSGRTGTETIDITVNGKDEPLTFVVDNTQTERTITDATTASDDDPAAQTGAIGLNPGSTFDLEWNVVELADMTTLLGERTIPANTDFGTISFPGSGGTNFVALGTPFDAEFDPITFAALPLDWSFDPTDAINLLDDGESVVLTYEITATNRGGPTTQNLVITLTGRDDAPEITGGLTGSSAGVNGATGRITATDIDGDTITFADSTNPAYGGLTFSRVGSTDEYEWTLDLNTTGEAALAALGDGDSENMTFSITATGGTEMTTETLTIELTPMLGFAAPSEVASAYMFLPAQGQIELTRGVTPVTSGLSYGVGLTEEAAKMNIEDPTHTVSNRNASPFGSFVLDDDGSWTYTLTAGPSGRATNLDSNGDGAHNHGDSTDVTVWVAVKDASGPAIAQELDIQIKGATFLDGRGTPAHVPLIADPNRATSGEDEYLRGNSNVNDIIHTGEGNNAVTGLSGDDMITLGNGATANDTQIDVLYHRAQFFFDAEDALIRSTNIDRASTIDNFIRNEDQFIFVRFVTAIVSEEVLLANADRFRLEATIEQDGNDFTLTGFKFGLTEAGGGISRGYITINYHDDHQVALTTNEALTKYGLSRNEVTNNIDTGQIITGAEVRHNYFGDDMNDSFQILDNIPQALEGIL